MSSGRLIEVTRIYPRSAIESKPGGDRSLSRYIFGGEQCNSNKLFYRMRDKGLLDPTVDLPVFRARLAYHVSDDVELTGSEIKILGRPKGARIK